MLREAATAEGAAGLALYAVRHGETSWNAEGRLQGRCDIPLNGRGRDQADAVGRALRGIIPAEAVFIASPLSRARETMERLRRALSLDPTDYQVEPALAELDFGDWDGLTWEEVKRRHRKGAQARETDKWNYLPPGGESYAVVSARLTPWLATLSGANVIVSHCGITRVMLAALGHLSTSVASVTDIPQGRAVLIERRGYRWL